MTNTVTAVDDDQLLDIAAVAKLLGYSRWWVQEHCTRKEPRLPVVKIGRLTKFRRSDLREFVEKFSRK